MKASSLDIYKPPAPAPTSIQARRILWSCAAAMLLAAGCQVPIHEQRLVSKPGMQFSRNPAMSYSSRIVPQILPGLEAGAEQASVCTICK